MQMASTYLAAIREIDVYLFRGMVKLMRTLSRRKAHAAK
jgi:hypothetical protein